ncbi:hypothetical protein [Streptomyces sp. NPDC092129]|uniref:hypothetical protein n=1 Tax=Streptomyces sp. NPDC092129 TaxID=3366010 RepID=UPI0038209F31
MTVTVRTDGSATSATVTFKKGPDPKPKKNDGECNACWAMGTNPHYDPNADDIPDAGKLATWQKVVLGLVAGVAGAVAVAPVAVAFGSGCLAVAPVCAAEIVEAATGGASGGSAVVGGGVGLVAAGRAAKGADSAANVLNSHRLTDSLRWESATSMFNKDGSLTEEAIRNSTMIHRAVG